MQPLSAVKAMATRTFRAVLKVVKMNRRALIFVIAVTLLYLMIPGPTTRLALYESDAEFSKMVSSIPSDIYKGDPDFKTVGHVLSLVGKVHRSIWNATSDSHLTEKQKLLTELDSKLYPWISPSFKSTLELKNSYTGEGIVIGVGDTNFDMAVTTMRMIRDVHACNLPFEVFFMGDEDLSLSNQDKLKTIPNTKVFDILKLMDDSVVRLKESRGWAIKPFALLFSSFSKAIAIDADVVFLQNPADLLYSPTSLFHEKGALFYTDRTLFNTENTYLVNLRSILGFTDSGHHYIQDKFMEWITDILGEDPSSTVKSLRIYQRKSLNELESGVVVMDKVRNFAGLLGICTLNTGDIRIETYKKVHGDKETYWIGFEATETPYNINPRYPGAAGVSKKVSERLGGHYEICARQLLHVDHHNQPVWINGGITESKFDSKSPLANLREWSSEPGSWGLLPEEYACISTPEKPNQFSEKMQRIIKQSGDIILTARAEKE